MYIQHRRWMLLTMFVAALVFPGASAALGQTFTFTNSTSITVNDGGTEGAPTASTPYGTTIPVSMCCVITRIEVSLNNVTHGRPEDMDIKLVGPTGIAVDLFRDAGGAAAAIGQTWTFGDRWAATAPDAGPMATGAYKPTVAVGETGNFPAPAPAGVQSVPLSEFIGTSPNGTWTLYIAEDSPVGVDGVVAGGWTLFVTIGRVFSNTGAITIPDTAAPGTPYPSNIVVSGVGVGTTKVTVKLNNFSHTFLDDIAILLVSPTGQKVRLTSDNGGNDGAAGEDFLFDETASNPLPDGGVPGVVTTIAGTTYAPSGTGTVGVGEGSAMLANFPAPAPANPYATSLLSFNGFDANGTWSLYVFDDTGGDSGSIAGGWTLAIEAPFVPTVAPVSISGRATTASGVGIGNAILTLTGGLLSEPLIARTNPFGYYQIDGVPAGGTYLLEISAKRYRFVQPSLVINAVDSVGDADFVAESK